jgi:uncharacterized protein (DUF3820 family)
MPDPALLVELAQARMPFGRYEGQLLLELPQAYLVWFQARGWPPGRLGQQMAAMLELDHNGLKDLLEPLRK